MMYEGERKRREGYFSYIFLYKGFEHNDLKIIGLSLDIITHKFPKT